MLKLGKFDYKYGAVFHHAEAKTSKKLVYVIFDEDHLSKCHYKDILLNDFSTNILDFVKKYSYFRGETYTKGYTYMHMENTKRYIKKLAAFML